MKRALLIVLLGGCELLVDVPKGTLVGVDPGDCTTGALACEAPTPVCNLDTATCVECLGNTDCSGARPFCDVSVNTCSAGCTVDSQCDSGACLADGTCADAARIKYAAVDGTGDCSQASPCALTTAIAQLAVGIDIIQLAAGAYETDTGFAPTSDVTFTGTDVVLRKLGTGQPLLQYAGISVGLHRITLESSASDQFTVTCTGMGKLIASKIRIDGAAAAISGQMCEVRIDRSRFSGNQFYAMFISGGPFVLTNSYITNNGLVNFSSGGLLLSGLVDGSRIEHNTIAGNVNRNAAPSYGGLVSCSGTFTAVIRNNIIRNNAIDPLCAVANNVIDPGYTGPGTPNVDIDPLFKDELGNDYHLMPSSPVAGMSDASSPTVFVDFDGDERSTAPDPGADEIP